MVNSQLSTRNASNLLATDLQAKALDFRTNALDALDTPLEVDLFLTYMADGPRTG